MTYRHYILNFRKPKSFYLFDLQLHYYPPILHFRIQFVAIVTTVSKILKLGVSWSLLLLLQNYVAFVSSTHISIKPKMSETNQVWNLFSLQQNCIAFENWVYCHKMTAQLMITWKLHKYSSIAWFVNCTYTQSTQNVRKLTRCTSLLSHKIVLLNANGLYHHSMSKQQ